MAGSFRDYDKAAKMRDLVTKIAENTVNRMRPEVMIGEVYRFDSATRYAYIRLPGHSDQELVRARYSDAMIPSSSVEAPINDEPDVVRITGKPGAFFILDYVKGQPRSSLYDTLTTEANNPASAAVYRDTDFIISTNTWTNIPFTKQSWAQQVTTTSPFTHYTVQVSGLWLLISNVTFRNNGTGYRASALRVNDVFVSAARTATTLSGGFTSMNISFMAYLQVGDQVSSAGWQNSQADLATVGGAAEVSLSMTRLGAIVPNNIAL